MKPGRFTNSISTEPNVSNLEICGSPSIYYSVYCWIFLKPLTFCYPFPWGFQCPINCEHVFFSSIDFGW